MYLIEWGWWGLQKMSADKRRETDLSKSHTRKRIEKDIYESDLDEVHFRSVSDTPKQPTPIYNFNQKYMDIRCGGSEEKRGLITIMTIGGILPAIYVTTFSAIGFAYRIKLNHQLPVLQVRFSNHSTGSLHQPPPNNPFQSNYTTGASSSPKILRRHRHPAMANHR